MIDDKCSDRYHVIDNDLAHHCGWQTGWEIFNRSGSPLVRLDVIGDKPNRNLSNVWTEPLDLSTLWRDTGHYEQNSPGILGRAHDLNRRAFNSFFDKAFWLNTLRVPICASYLSACAKVYPKSILELGTGGDSAHSTGMFLCWLSQLEWGRLVSVDRHPLSTVWPRYRDHFKRWDFIQGDSVSVMHAILLGKIDLPKWWDMIFIDSSHEHQHTLAELNQASRMTDAILMDDSTFPGVKAALDEWLPENQDWLRVDLHSAVTLLERHPIV